MKAPGSPDIRTRDLRAIVALGQHPRFADAAARLRTPQPALTRAVKRVERALGVALFTRTTRHVALTSAGRQFSAVAERVLAELDLAQRQLGGGRAPGRVTISTYSAFAVHVLPPLIRRYRELQPSVELAIRERRQDEILEDVRSDTADFGIGYVDSLPDVFASGLLRREPLYVVMPVRHRLARRRRIRIEELRDELLVSPPSDTFLRRLVDGAASGAGIELRHGLTVERLLSVLGHVAGGVGVGVVPEGVLPPKPWIHFEAAHLVEPSLSVSVGLITQRDRYMPPAAAKLAALIRRAYRRLEPSRGVRG